MNELLELANQQKVRLLDSPDALCVLCTYIQHVRHMPCLLLVVVAVQVTSLLGVGRFARGSTLAH